jgi:hypothetical protein
MLSGLDAGTVLSPGARLLFRAAVNRSVATLHPDAKGILHPDAAIHLTIRQECGKPQGA